MRFCWHGRCLAHRCSWIIKSATPLCNHVSVKMRPQQHPISFQEVRSGFKQSILLSMGYTLDKRKERSAGRLWLSLSLAWIPAFLPHFYFLARHFCQTSRWVWNLGDAVAWPHGILRMPVQHSFSSVSPSGCVVWHFPMSRSC